MPASAAGAPPPPEPQPTAVEAAILRQGDILAKAFEKLGSKGTAQGSAIKVQPQVKWPILEDSTKDIRE